MGNCMICNSCEATKTNSHIVPSFLIAMVSSWNQSYKRDKEILFYINGIKNSIYTGQIPDTKYEELFDLEVLTQKRIESELKDNPAVEDFIFCPECENNLAKFLESPYAENLMRNKKTTNDIAAFFWLSVIWRMSISGEYGFCLPEHIEHELGALLNRYIQKKKQKESVDQLITELPFKYKILWCRDYCKQNSGCIYAKYYPLEKQLFLLLGDGVLCFNFDFSKIGKDVIFMETDTYLKIAPINDGTSTEQIFEISNDDLSSIYRSFMKWGSRECIHQVICFLDKVWHQIGLFGYMPLRMKYFIIRQIYNDDTKLGDRFTKHRLAKIIFYAIKYPLSY